MKIVLSAVLTLSLLITSSSAQCMGIILIPQSGGGFQMVFTGVGVGHTDDGGASMGTPPGFQVSFPLPTASNREYASIAEFNAILKEVLDSTNPQETLTKLSEAQILILQSGFRFGVVSKAFSPPANWPEPYRNLLAMMDSKINEEEIKGLEALGEAPHILYGYLANTATRLLASKFSSLKKATDSKLVDLYTEAVEELRRTLFVAAVHLYNSRLSDKDSEAFRKLLNIEAGDLDPLSDDMLVQTLGPDFRKRFEAYARKTKGETVGFDSELASAAFFTTFFVTMAAAFGEIGLNVFLGGSPESKIMQIAEYISGSEISPSYLPIQLPLMLGTFVAPPVLAATTTGFLGKWLRKAFGSSFLEQAALLDDVQLGKALEKCHRLGWKAVVHAAESES